MFGNKLTLFTLFGFKVQVDASWIIIAVLVTWSLALGVFPGSYRGLEPATYWVMGIVGALGLFASIVFHELSHSLVSRGFHLPIRGITLFVFGGVAEMEEEPESPKAEFFMAIAGPVASGFLAAVCYGFGMVGASLGWPTPVRGVIAYIGRMNLLLLGFNLLPAFPLDGGRVLRSILWRWKGTLPWATHISSRIGTAFGFALMAIGFYFLITASLFTGMWWILIGLFLRNASQMSYRRLLMRRALEGEPVRRFMKTDVITVSPATSILDLVENYVYRYHFKMFPVVDGGRLLGCVSVGVVKGAAREEWAAHSVGDILKPCSKDNTVTAGDDATTALAIMNRTGSSRLMVVEGEQLIGVIALKDLLNFLALKLDLEGGGDQ